MEASYAPAPPPPQSYSMPPGVSPTDSTYRREAPPSQYPGAPVSQHLQNGQSYPYNPTSIPNPPQRGSISDPVPVGDNQGQITAPTGPPPSHSMVELDRRYTLDVVQQPRRARMCGFGDKDRRPITPPPCIRLIITDARTGQEIDTNDIEHGLFVLNVDLWSADGTKEVNLVRHSATSPAISSTVPISYAHVQGIEAPVYPSTLPAPGGVRDPQYPYYPNQPPPPPTAGASGQMQGYNPYPQQPQVNPYSQHSPQQGQPQGPYGTAHQPPPQGYPRPSTPGYSGPNRYQEPPNHPYYHPGSTVHAVSQTPARPGEAYAFNPNDPNLQRLPVTSAPTGMFTRNLIGSLSASAFRLADPNDKIGIWFVLQDLSVRTEGTFRLRFSFVNVGAPSKTPNGNPANQISIVNTGKAPILASCYSDVFTVYSAKKFPGVVESTPLSKCFATQGIKIPIRKDGPSKSGNRDEYDED